MPSNTLNIAVFASGGGSNFQAIHDACVKGTIPGRISLVVASSAKAGVLERAARHNIPSRICNISDDAMQIMEGYEVDIVVLAGYMRLIPEHVVTAFKDRMLNVHPSLLPAFGGKGMYGTRVHEAVVRHGVKVTGATIHLVDNAYDSGPIVLQEAIPVESHETPDDIAARVLEVEHRIYPEAVRLLAEKRLHREGRRVHILPKTSAS
ncbi:MAG: phosphoribosylglycinamide formyltransferase [Bacteroidetes bacterium CG12_big_fil_rev_8_21_14_0_65_60_17]|nr:MAG: phosphoribosylglycinamide formyltransferase [Bacteroidetes bacterium CG12_big_fil_rev_8_21_14_0_65_60_17]